MAMLVLVGPPDPRGLRESGEPLAPLENRGCLETMGSPETLARRVPPASRGCREGLATSAGTASTAPRVDRGWWA